MKAQSTTPHRTRTFGSQQHLVAGPQAAAVPQRGRDRDGAPGRHDGHAVGIAADHDDTGVSGQGQPVTRPPVQHLADGLAYQPAGGIDPAHPVNRVRREGERIGQRQRAAPACTAGLTTGRAGSRRDHRCNELAQVSVVSQLVHAYG